MKTNLCTLLAAAAMTSLGFGQTIYTWTGAEDDLWANINNWDANGVPVDDNLDRAGLSLNSADKVVFGGSNMPIDHPGIDGAYSGGGALQDGRWSTPTSEFNSGGAVSFAHTSANNNGMITNLGSNDRTVLTVGDGIVEGADETVEVTVTNGFTVERHGNGIHTLLVNADGTLIIQGGLDMGYRDDRGGRYGVLNVAGGITVVNGQLTDVNGGFDGDGGPDDSGRSHIEFSELGGSLTALYGTGFGGFPDFGSVIEGIGLGIDSRIFNNSGGELQVEESLDGLSFTITAVEPPDPIYWTGTQGPVWDQSTTANWSNNLPEAALSETNFAAAVAADGRGIFGDNYFNTGTPIAVTQTMVEIAAGGVSTDGIFFSNTAALSYEISSVDGIGIKDSTNVLINGGGTVTLASPNTHTGSTSVLPGSTLVLADSLALQSSRLSGGGAVIFDEAVGSNSFTVGALAAGGEIVLENNAATPAPVELIVGNDDEDSTSGALLSGAGGLTKVGTGLTLLGDEGGESTFTGDTVVKSGTLGSGGANDSVGFSRGSTVYIGDTSGAEDATVQFDSASTTTFPDTVNFVVQSGNTGMAALTSSGRSTIEGTVTLGSDGVGKDVLVKVGADNGWWYRFNGAFQDPAGLTGTPGNLTIDTTFDGVDPAFGRIVELGGQSTHSGVTIANSRLQINAPGYISFYPTGTDGTVNQLTGAAGMNVMLDGGININLTNTPAELGSTWTLVDPNLDAQYGLNFFVTSPTGGWIYSESDAKWFKPNGINQWAYFQDTFTLTYEVAPASPLWTGLGGVVWDEDTTVNFGVNAPADALVEATFAAGTTGGVVAFGDFYWNGGVEIDVLNSDLTIEGSGVEATLIEFTNTSETSYTVGVAEGAVGISGESELRVRGGGAVTLTGEHDYGGDTTIAEGSTLNFGDGTTDVMAEGTLSVLNGGSFFWNVAENPFEFDEFLSSPRVENSGTFIINTVNEGVSRVFTDFIGGAGTFEKQGAGSLVFGDETLDPVLPLVPTYSGPTVVSGGKLTFLAHPTSQTFHIETGATLDLAYPTNDGTYELTANSTFTGGGRLLYSGTALSRWGGTVGTFALDSGALIDIQAGILRGGSNANEVWTGNLSDLNVAAGAEFWGVEANVEVDVLTGDGIISSGWVGAGYLNFTIGVDNGSENFDGVLVDNTAARICNLRKVGTGTQTFSGLNTYVGSTTIEAGAITIADTGQATFIVGANMVSTLVTGAGTLNLDGALNLNVGGADTTPGNSWLLVDVAGLAGVNYGASFRVITTTGASFMDMGAGLWQLDAGGNLWSYNGTSGTLSVEEGSALGYSDFQTTYFTEQQIIDGDAGEGVDFDGGGLENGIEFVVGGDPTDGSDDAAVAPTTAKVEGGYEFTYRRTIDSAADNPGVEYGSDLVGYTQAQDGVDGVTITVNVDGFGVGIDQVIVFLPDSLAVDGKLFARLSVAPAM